jgi:FAD/FMN-containing dehydrogenase
MASSSNFTDPSTESLKEIVAGDVLVPGDDGYDDARRGFFLKRGPAPAVVVLAEFAQDVVAAVQFARSVGMRIAPQGTGHGALPLEPLEGAMLLRTSRMRRVEIGPLTCIARAEAGAEWRDVTVPAAEYGLAALAGTSPNVGVTGYTLGGGLGWLGRRYGLAANSVTAVELVTMDGRLRRVDARHDHTGTASGSQSCGPPATHTAP